MRHETKQALAAIAKSSDMSLSEMFLQSAVDRYLYTRSTLPVPTTNRLTDRLGKLEKHLTLLIGLLEAKPSEESAPIKEPNPVDPNDPKGRKVRPGAQTFFRDSTPVISAVGSIDLHELMERFGGDKALKARLCQLGGRDELLFKGDITKANKVASVTSQLDPDSLPWFPIAADRRNWVQISAVDFVRQIINA